VQGEESSLLQEGDVDRERWVRGEEKEWPDPQRRKRGEGRLTKWKCSSTVKKKVELGLKKNRPKSTEKKERREG